MSTQKDIDRIRELIIGGDIKRFEQKFDAIEIQLNAIEEKQAILSKKIKKQRKKINLNVEDMNSQIQFSTRKSSEQLKTLKTELMIHIESKLNGNDKTTITKKQLAKMFATLSLELEDKLDTKKYEK